MSASNRADSAPPYSTPEKAQRETWPEEMWASEWLALCALADRDEAASVADVMGGLVQREHAHWNLRHLARAERASRELLSPPDPEGGDKRPA